MEVFEAIRTRRSIRKYKDKAVPWDNIVTIMQAGKYAPSAGNLQNWKFIYVKTDAKRQAITKGYSAMRSRKVTQCCSARTVVGTSTAT